MEYVVKIGGYDNAGYELEWSDGRSERYMSRAAALENVRNTTQTGSEERYRKLGYVNGQYDWLDIMNRSMAAQ